jgi:hypothetical protein
MRLFVLVALCVPKTNVDSALETEERWKNLQVDVLYFVCFCFTCFQKQRRHCFVQEFVHFFKCENSTRSDIPLWYRLFRLFLLLFTTAIRTSSVFDSKTRKQRRKLCDCDCARKRASAQSCKSGIMIKHRLYQ